MAAIREFFEVYPRNRRDTVPLGICFDGVIYASGLMAANGLKPQRGDLLQQFSAALERMRECVEQAGATLDEVARVTAYVGTVEDRMPLYGQWEKLFPIREDRPAFKVLVAPLPESCRVRLDLIAIIGGRRQRYDIEGVPGHDPTIKIADWVFTSRIHGTMPHGQIDPSPVNEAVQTFDNIDTLVLLAGIPSLQPMQITTFNDAPAGLPIARKVLSERGTKATSRQSLISMIPSHLSIMAEMVANSGIHFQELYVSPETNPEPSGIRLGPLVFLPAVVGINPETGQIAADDTAGQLRRALSNVEALLHVAGCTCENLARATFFMRDLADRPILNEVWEQAFPDPQQRPPHKYVSAPLPAGVSVVVQAIALHGTTRRELLIDGLKHGDPMAMGAKTGPLVTSSRLFGQEAFTGRKATITQEHLAIVLAHADTLLAQAGLTRSALQQITAFIADEAAAQAARDAVQRYYPSVRLHLIETQLGGGNFPRIEIVAIAPQ